MKRIESTGHFSATDTELDKVTWSCEAKDLLRDIKFFVREYYTGFYSEDGNSLVIKFNNGQNFSINVNEIK